MAKGSQDGSLPLPLATGPHRHRINKRFRIAFSFAGEKRPFVAEMARILADRFGDGHILYDKYHEAEFARSNLAFHLPSLYEEEADLVVVVFCNGYLVKEWCGLEWNAIYGLIKKRMTDEVILMRFDQVEPEGLFGLAGFSDLDKKTPAEAVTLILQRLALNEGHEKDFYNTSHSSDNDWPEVAPCLDWHVADHSEAQHTFAQLITRGTPFRLLLIHGPTETGKTHLTKQFLRNAYKIPALCCGRFDFKGSTDMDGELRSFAQQLEVDVPSSGTISSLLADIFASLKRAARPTLLIFDTFELAGEAERWIKESLLLSILRAPWLRVIIVGQRPVKVHGEPWDGIASPPIELHSPTVQEWFNYGKLYKTDLTTAFVSQAHGYVDGSSALLAQLLGPGE